jgi:hypothetical protein
MDPHSQRVASQIGRNSVLSCQLGYSCVSVRRRSVLKNRRMCCTADESHFWGSICYAKPSVVLLAQVTLVRLVQIRLLAIQVLKAGTSV